MRKKIKEFIIKRLYALSNNQCAFPNCKQQLFNKEGDNLSNICHIESAKEGGARYNSNSNDEYRRRFENLILLCPTHHKETDNTKIYTVDKLKEMKKIHENSNFSHKISKNPSVLKEVITLLSNSLSEEIKSESSNKAPDIEHKIHYNKIIRYKAVIEKYRIYQGKLNSIYAEIEKFGSDKKIKLLKRIELFYLENKYIENSDDILDEIKNLIYNKIENSNDILNIEIEVLEISILIIIVDAFMRCKILEDPKNDSR